MVSKWAVDATCKVLGSIGEINGWSQTEIDFAVMGAARDFYVPSGGRAEEYLRHYLNGTGLPKTFGAHLLINEDAGVKVRLSSEIVVQLANRLDPVTGQVMPGARGQVWLRQQPMDFKNRDWLFAIGSFLMEWEFVEQFTGQGGVPFVTVRVHGQNEYRWDPETQRRSACVHRAADRLRTPGGGFTPAKNFTMHALPALMHLPKPTPRGRLNLDIAGLRNAIKA